MDVIHLFLQRKLIIGGVEYTYVEDGLQDTDYGPENRVRFFKDGEHVDTWQEAAGVDLIIQWFVGTIKEQMQAQAWIAQGKCGGCGGDKPKTSTYCTHCINDFSACEGDAN